MTIESPDDCRKGIQLQWLVRPLGATATEYLVLLILGVMLLLGVIHLFGGGVEEQYRGAVSIFQQDGDDSSLSEQSRSGSRTTGREEGSVGSSQTHYGSDEVWEDSHDRGAHGHGGASVSSQNSGARGSLAGVNPFVAVILVVSVIVVGVVLFSEDD